MCSHKVKFLICQMCKIKNKITHLLDTKRLSIIWLMLNLFLCTEEVFVWKIYVWKKEI